MRLSVFARLSHLNLRLSVPSLSVPSLSVPCLSVLGLTALSLTVLSACNSPRPAPNRAAPPVQQAAAQKAPTQKASAQKAPAPGTAAQKAPAPKVAAQGKAVPQPAAPVREQPAPAQPDAKGRLELIEATPEVPADIVIHNAVGKASEDGKDVLVYVGASWCAPCVRFKKAAKAGKFDAELAGVRVLVFDADKDTDRLNKAGYTWTYVPLFVRPGVNGRSSGVQIAGVPNKEDGAADLVPRIQKLLGRTKK